MKLAQPVIVHVCGGGRRHAHQCKHLTMIGEFLRTNCTNLAFLAAIWPHTAEIQVLLYAVCFLTLSTFSQIHLHMHSEYTALPLIIRIQRIGK